MIRMKSKEEGGILSLKTFHHFNQAVLFMGSAVSSYASKPGKVRLTGLTSGMDTEAIVEQLLAVDRQQIDKLKEDKEIESAKIQTWGDISQQLKTLAQSVTKLKSDGTTGYTLFDNKTTVIGDPQVVTATVSSAAIPATYSMSVVTLAAPAVAYGAQLAVNYTLPTSGTIHLNGTTISLTAGQTLSEITQQINNAPYAAGDEITAIVIDRRLVLQSQTGADYAIEGTVNGAHPFTLATDDPNDILKTQFGILDGSGDFVNAAQNSGDAVFLINNIAMTHSSNTVTDAIPGMTLNLLNPGTSMVEVVNDTKGIKETIKTFVNSYNETRDLINRTRTAKLSDEDQFGLFHSDSLLKELFSSLRQSTTSGVCLGGSIWKSTLTAQAPALLGATSLSITGFASAVGSLQAGDSFVIDGDTTVYKLQNSASVAANASTVMITPALTQAVAGGASIRVVTRTLDDIGVGVRTDSVSGVDGILGVLDEGLLDNMLSSNLSLVKTLFTRVDANNKASQGIAGRLYTWIDAQTKISYFQTTKRNIDDIKIASLKGGMERIDDHVKRLEGRLKSKENSLLRKFTQMESAISRAQSAGGSIAGLAGGQQGK
ncbi:MAG: fliD [Chlamydiales bacterium]|jgi:flagellar capping protein FliD|nr:fliD [Chlamydiales bacterium]